LFDESGNVVGVVVAKLNAARVAAYTGDIPQNVNFAVKSSRLSAFLASNRLSSGPANKTERLDRIRLAEIARTQTVQLICHSTSVR